MECGFFVCHYIEEEMRAMAKMGYASQGWPDETRLRNLRQYIMKVSTFLELERQRWANEMNKQVGKPAVEAEKKAQEALRRLQARGILGHSVRAHQLKVEASLGEGAGEGMPPIPEGFGITVKIVSKPVKASKEGRKVRLRRKVRSSRRVRQRARKRARLLRKVRNLRRVRKRARLRRKVQNPRRVRTRVRLRRKMRNPRRVRRLRRKVQNLRRVRLRRRR